MSKWNFNEQSILYFFANTLDDLKKIYKSNKKKIKNQSEKLKYKTRLNQSVFFILALNATYMISLFCMVLFRDGEISSTQYVKIMFLFITLVVVSGFFLLPHRMRYYGLNLKEWRFNLKFGFLFGLICTISAIWIRMELIKQGKVEFQFRIFPEWEFYIYPLSVFSQEMMTKGYLQNYFQSIFDHTEFNTFLAIFISSLIFGLMHLMYGFGIMILSTLFSILLGIFYNQTKSLLGVYIVHFMTGTALFYFKY
jgi:membrane protease YdiL (CAAX protease family)